MSELDAVIDQCRRQAVFASGIVRDTSNRSDRDWPWWSVEIQQTQENGSVVCRAIVTVRLNAVAAGEPGSFEASWQARVWQGTSVDCFQQSGGWPLPWDHPSPRQFEDTMAALLVEARGSMDRFRLGRHEGMPAPDAGSGTNLG